MEFETIPDDKDSLRAWRAGQYTREQWLNEMAGVILDLYANAYGIDWTPPLIRVSCGWPGVTAGGRVECVRGVTYSSDASRDGYHEIFINPVIDNAAEAVATLAHEITHAVAGVKHDHGAPFVAAGSLIGMRGEPTTLLPGAELTVYLDRVLADAPAYPHAGLKPPPPEAPAAPQDTRMLKGMCPTCGYVIRLTMKWASRGMPICPFDNVAFSLCERKENKQ